MLSYGKAKIQTTSPKDHKKLDRILGQIRNEKYGVHTVTLQLDKANTVVSPKVTSSVGQRYYDRLQFALMNSLFEDQFTLKTLPLSVRLDESSFVIRFLR